MTRFILHHHRLAVLALVLAVGLLWPIGVEPLVHASGLSVTRTPTVRATRTPRVRRTPLPHRTVRATRTPSAQTTPMQAATPTPVAGVVPLPTGRIPDEWLARLNYYRALGNVHPVVEESAWRASDEAHARYMVKTDTVSHSEESGNPFYNAAGLEAAEAGNIMVSGQEDTPDREAMDYWMAAPFHGIALIDPQLEKSAFGSYREADGGWQMAATLDVRRGLGEAPETQSYPIIWPQGNPPIPLAFPGSEWPDGLGGCPGYEIPVGAPLYIQMGEGEALFFVSDHSLKRDGEPIEHCVFDETSFTHPDPSQQAVGRTILGLRDAIVILPRDPLIIGSTYEVSVTVSGQPITWSFTPREAADPTEPQEPRLPAPPSTPSDRE